MRNHKVKPRIVLVDDEPDFLTLAKGWLEPEYEAVGLADASDIKGRLEELEPDLLILDVGLPERNGLSVCKEVTNDPRFQTLPVLFLTGSGSDADFIRAVGAGCSSYLKKPISRKEMLSWVREFVGPAPSQAW